MDGRCRRHPEHKQSSGVCPFCLREKLNSISASSSATTTVASSTTSSSGKSTGSGFPSAAAASPPPVQGTKIPAVAASLKSKWLSKSRSLPFVSGKRSGEVARRDMEKGKQSKEGRSEKVGFWSKLMSAGSRKRKQVVEYVL